MRQSAANRSKDGPMSILVNKRAPVRAWPASAELQLDGRPVAVAVRVHQRARGYRLSIPQSGRPVLTVPPYGRWSDAEAFLNRHANWLAVRLERTTPPQPLGEGALVPLRDVPHRVVGTGRVRGRVELAERDGQPVLLVPGAPEHLSRRLADWLKAEAQRDLAERVALHAAKLGVSVKALSLRAQTSRWGSCSSSGRLSFNWKLILTPPFVLDYVAAHEVAHLIEMNHSPAFWARVEQALPDMARGRAWLKAHGRRIMAYGA
jgi:predicted metal-dependent hydrolase